MTALTLGSSVMATPTKQSKLKKEQARSRFKKAGQQVRGSVWIYLFCELVYFRIAIYRVPERLVIRPTLRSSCR
jgi:hypothetical protein